MNKWQQFNLVVFIVLIFITVSLIYVLTKIEDFSVPLGKPWHLLSAVHEDSLSSIYKDTYQILGKQPLYSVLLDSSKINVFILVDAWGVPTKEEILAKDLKTFENINHRFILHRRLANYTRHAERVELRSNSTNSVYLFGGDSLQFNRHEYIPDLGLQESIYCNKCDNENIIEKIDSLLNENEPPHFIAWTALASPVGEHGKIRQILQQIANLAEKHTDVRFVVQGSHRPMICGPKVKNSYKSHWVPVAILNE